MNIDRMALVHEYRRLARRGGVPPLTHECGEEYTVRVVGDQIRFQCFSCGSITDLGLADIKAMEAVIEDYKAKRTE